MSIPNLNEKTWRPFFVKDIFETIQRGKRLKTADHIQGNKPYVSSSAQNNGVDNFIDNNENVRTFEDCLTIANSGSVGKSFYHPYEFVASDHVTILRSANLNKYHYLFIATLLDKLSEKYSFNREINDVRLRREKIMLPVNDSGEPDFDFMENYMRAIETKQLQRWRDFVQEIDSAQIAPLSEKTWRIFNLSDVFSICATSSGIDKNKLKLTAGEFPYITRTDRNNGIQCYICEQPDYKRDKGNCITVGLDTQTAFYQPTDFYTGQNIQILRHERLDNYVAKFILPCLKKTLSIFSWGGNGATLTRLRRSKIQLPVTDDGAPDFAYMEAYIKNLVADKYRRYLDYLNQNEKPDKQ